MIILLETLSLASEFTYMDFIKTCKVLIPGEGVQVRGLADRAETRGDGGPLRHPAAPGLRADHDQVHGDVMMMMMMMMMM